MKVCQTFLREINESYSALRQKGVERGDSYNIFRVIHMSSCETKVHSAFIADLLNPRGQHGMKDLFLCKFLEIIGTRGLHMDTDTCRVEIEKYIGEKTSTTGGRLDIIVKDSQGQSIIIENKIYASDQNAQMLRYFNYAESQNKPYILLYLSIDGTVHDELRTTSGVLSIGKDFYTISYREDILRWLEQCLILAEGRPLLHEGIAHYLNLVKHITGKDMEKKDCQELVNQILSQEEYVKNINRIQHILQETKKELASRYWESLFDAMVHCGMDILLLTRTDGKSNVLQSPSKDDIIREARKFRLRGDRNKYSYQFGLAIPVGEEMGDGTRFMLGVIVDSAVSLRLFSIDSRGPKIVADIPVDIQLMRDRLSGEHAGWVQKEEFYIAARYMDDDPDRWNLGEMYNSTLDNLSDMEQCISHTLNQLIEYRDKVLECLDAMK